MDLHAVMPAVSPAKSCTPPQLQDVRHGSDQGAQVGQIDIESGDDVAHASAEQAWAPSPAAQRQEQLVSPTTNQAEELPRRTCVEWIEAAKSGDTLELRRLLRTPSLLNKQVGGLQCTAAHWAAANGHADALQLLVRAGADITVRTATGCMPLHSAAAAGRAECVQLLVAGCDTGNGLQQHQLAAVNEDGLTPAALALRHGHKMVQGMLLQAAAAVQATPAASDVREAMMHAAHMPETQQQRSKQSGMQRGFLLGSMGPRNLPHTQQQHDGHGGSSDINSCQFSSSSCQAAGTPAQAEAGNASLAPAAADATSADPCGWHSTVDNPLFGVACSPIKQQHAQHHAQLQTSSCLGRTATSSAAGHATNVEGAAPCAQEVAGAVADTPGSTAGAAACTQVKQQQVVGTTAVPVDRVTGRAWLDAARAGDLPRLQLLLQQHPQLLDYRGHGTSYAFVGNSALHWAAAKGHVPCVTWLLQQGAAVGAVNEAGATALHTAVEHGQPSCAEVLVCVGGADVQVGDGYGQTPVALAAATVTRGSSQGSKALAQQLRIWEQARKAN